MQHHQREQKRINGGDECSDEATVPLELDETIYVTIYVVLWPGSGSMRDEADDGEMSVSMSDMGIWMDRDGVWDDDGDDGYGDEYGDG